MEGRVLVVAAAIVDDLEAPRRLLAARRRAPVSLAGRWEFPGGKVDAGESPEQALHREIAEELGVEVTLGAELPGPDGGPWPLPKGYAMRLWFAAIRSGTPRPLVEHDQLRWLATGQWAEVAWLDGDVPIVHALMANTAQVAHPRTVRMDSPIWEDA